MTAVALALSVASGACRPVDLSEDPRIRLGVVSSGGVVYLSGTVVLLDERERAEGLSRAAQGVRRVVNTLEVQPE